MPLFILGAIVVVGVILLLRNYDTSGKKKVKAEWTDVPPEGSLKKDYKKSNDGKVVFLYDEDKKDE